MWINLHELRRLGFRRLSEYYWQCDGRHGLPPEGYLSLFAHALAGPRLDVCAFHVTFCLGVDRVHFYYHERAEELWEPGGHTSSQEIRRYARDPLQLRAEADAVADALLQAWGMCLLGREEV